MTRRQKIESDPFLVRLEPYLKTGLYRMSCRAIEIMQGVYAIAYFLESTESI
jgi:hypothetical protein